MSGRDRNTDVLVVGGGPAGLAAALAAAESGAEVRLVERDVRLGGILPQCVHDGFGLEVFGESLTGPEYAARLSSAVRAAGVRVDTDSTVLAVGADLACEVLSPTGFSCARPRAVVLAMGCRERSFGSLVIPGPRVAGIYSAGCAQRLVNIEGVMVGRRAVVLGSGDVGLIMARRMTLEGASVACVVEKMPYPGGLPRNVSQCLNDFGIPLHLSTTVVGVHGRGRLSAVDIADADETGRPSMETARTVECDTLLVSVGLIPENELTRDAGAKMDDSSGGAVVDQDLMTSMRGVFACGNVLHVNDLADWASLEGRRAGERAASWASDPWAVTEHASVTAGPGVRYVVPQRVRRGGRAVLSFRVTEPIRRPRVAVVADGATLCEVGFTYLAPSELATLEVSAVPAGVGSLEVGLVRSCQ